MDQPLKLNCAEYQSLARSLQDRDPASVIPVIAGLLTVPAYHPETVRIELLLHLACLHCCGRRKITTADLRRWLGRDLANLPVASLEDPPEDVFISNVIAPGGNYRIFEGRWESADYYLQHALDCVVRSHWAKPFKDLRRNVQGILALSDSVAGRAGVDRWTESPEAVPEAKFLRSSPGISELARRVTFSPSELAALGIEPASLEPFLLQPADVRRLHDETVGHTTLERYPLIRFGDLLVCGCPTAISPAIRRYLLDSMADHGRLEEFAQVLRLRQASAVFEEILPQIDLPTGEWEGTVPAPDRTLMHPADVAIVPIDRDKLAYVVLLHDDLSTVREHGFSAMLPPDIELGEHLAREASRLKNLGYNGLVLVVWAGLGRGHALALPEFPAGWKVGALGLPDLDFSRELKVPRFYGCGSYLRIAMKLRHRVSV